MPVACAARRVAQRGCRACGRRCGVAAALRPPMLCGCTYPPPQVIGVDPSEHQLAHAIQVGAVASAAAAAAAAAAACARPRPAHARGACRSAPATLMPTARRTQLTPPCCPPYPPSLPACLPQLPNVRCLQSAAAQLVSPPTSRCTHAFLPSHSSPPAAAQRALPAERGRGADPAPAAAVGGPHCHGGDAALVGGSRGGAAGVGRGRWGACGWLFGLIAGCLCWGTHPLAPPTCTHCRIDHNQFYEQARRLLKPTGALAIWCVRGQGRRRTAGRAAAGTPDPAGTGPRLLPNPAVPSCAPHANRRRGPNQRLS